jgi:hypothetical protein
MILDELVREIQPKTKEVKRKKLYVLNLLGQILSIRWLKKHDRRHRAKFYRHNYPLWGGITNVDLAWYWEDLPCDDFYYFRAASVGPAVPLALAITTANNRVSLAVSSNPQIFKAEDIENIMNDFVATLSSFPETKT